MTIVKQDPNRKLMPYTIWTMFARKWEEMYGRPYVVTGRDKKACSRLKELSFSDLNARMDAYLKSPWPGSQDRRHELWLFAAMANRYVPATDVFKPKEKDVEL